MKTWLTVVVLLVLAVGAYVLWGAMHPKPSGPVVTTFEECAEAGYPIMESYPRQCRDAWGTLFVEVVPPFEEFSDVFITLQGETDIIRLTTPLQGAVVASPLTIEGEARGMWYFEADFPVELRTADDMVLATGIATAQGEWMTEEYVPFTSTLTFTVPDDVTEGVLILHRDNPSDLPENDDSLFIPVSFVSGEPEFEAEEFLIAE